MAKFLVKANYTAEGLKGLQKALLSVEEADQALAKNVSYKAPGR